MDKQMEGKWRREEETKIMKKSKTISNRDAGDDIRNSTSLFLGDDVLSNILSRLPVKSLMQYKSVCKDWYHLIRHDQHFCDLHLTRSKNKPLLLSSIRFGEECISLCPIGVHEFVATTQAPTNNIHGKFNNLVGIMKPVNGLICFIDYFEDSAFFVYNLSTREKRRLGTIEDEYKTKRRLWGLGYVKSLTYGMGFDPTTKLHKVIRIWYVKPKDSTSPKRRFCQVFTIGKDDPWRRINDIPPPSKICGHGVHANGSIYWMTCSDYNGFKNYSNFIVGFDVRSEKFRRISVPNFVNQRCNLLEIDGCISISKAAIMGSTSKNILWILQDENPPHEKEKRSNHWIEETIYFDSEELQYTDPEFEAFTGTNTIIIRCTETNKRVCYLYDRENKTSKKICTTPDLGFSMTSFVESIFPLQKQLL